MRRWLGLSLSQAARKRSPTAAERSRLASTSYITIQAAKKDAKGSKKR
jgi:hypothetical protein